MKKVKETSHPDSGSHEFGTAKRISNTFAVRKLCVTVAFMLILLQAQAIDFFKGTYREALAKAGKENKLVLLYFTATWCGPCKYMDLYIFPDPELTAMVSANYIPLKLRLDKDDTENKVIYHKYNPGNQLSVPQFIFINSKEEVIKRKGGSMTLKKLKEFVKMTDVYTPLPKAAGDSIAQSVAAGKKLENASLFTKFDWWARHSKWQPGIQLGINRYHASPHSSGFHTFRTGFNIGLFFERDTKDFVIRPAINFITKGSENLATGQSLRLNYIEIPVRLGINVFRPKFLGQPIRLNLAPYGAFATGGRQKGWEVLAFGDEVGDICRYDYGLKTGVSVELGSFEALLGYDFGLKDISNGAANKMYNRGFWFEVSLTFGQ